MIGKALPEHERKTIAAEVCRLLQERDAHNRRMWTTTSLAEACGNLGTETIRKAREPDGVGPVVRNAILELTRMTMDQLMAAHGMKPPPPGTETAVTRPFRRLLTTSSVRVDKVGLAQKVLKALEEMDGYPREHARNLVGGLVLDGRWATEFELYCQARALLEAQAEGDQAERIGERPVRRAGTSGDAAAAATSSRKKRSRR